MVDMFLNNMPEMVLYFCLVVLAVEVGFFAVGKVIRMFW